MHISVSVVEVNDEDDSWSVVGGAAAEKGHGSNQNDPFWRVFSVVSIRPPCPYPPSLVRIGFMVGDRSTIVGAQSTPPDDLVPSSMAKDAPTWWCLVLSVRSTDLSAAALRIQQHQ
ncbi:hypothetical protein GGTG_01783 [Gaeumannomyces tritici R3-111a-1]|uniref:Uncharacterized protein n=1 Tax=Gaeumannomyces tritici (strain R3-111a-1) TaxID=644352 RepID=J3NKJ2_GAET3|nr:hypothetical protein GGTG_01783 [Gaeumannomyces tritici R3-111a-1]EJT81809.1 hypothetical protein GGTG_01783 [Gaeumannomyces tritici R3-111a-1]